jgi:hypothetical protein
MLVADSVAVFNPAGAVGVFVETETAADCALSPTPFTEETL